MKEQRIVRQSAMGFTLAKLLKFEKLSALTKKVECVY